MVLVLEMGTITGAAVAGVFGSEPVARDIVSRSIELIRIETC